MELLRSNDTMSFNILAAIASRTSHLASSTSNPGLYLDSCQTLVIGTLRSDGRRMSAVMTEGDWEEVAVARRENYP